MPEELNPLDGVSDDGTTASQAEAGETQISGEQIVATVMKNGNEMTIAALSQELDVTKAQLAGGIEDASNRGVIKATASKITVLVGE